MKEITILIDKSGSMKTLGKEDVSKDLIKFLTLYPQINSCEDRISFIQQDWDGNNETLYDICKDINYFVILTDGYACNDHCETTLQTFSIDKEKEFAIVLIGADSYFRQIDFDHKIPVFKAADIDVLVESFTR